jgi:hypothetical protein
MADLLGVHGGPATTNGDFGASTRPTAPPIQTGSPLQGIRGPRMILKEREERAARREREQLERDRAAQEARIQEETQRRAAAERRAAAAAGAASAVGAAPGPSGDPSAQVPLDQGTAQRRRRQSQQAEVPGRSGEAGARTRTSGQQQVPEAKPATAAQAAQYSEIPPRQAAAVGGPNLTAAAATAGGSRNRTSFPHAFERWEALSAHWEGMISYWIHKLEERKDDIDRDSINRQLAQQVADLSAAGANLFHAVVNLQKLRASSERKFQRWFFETRSELERNQEITAMLEASLQEERRNREEAIRDAVERSQTHSKTEKTLLELRKELSISKDEARRAWEELGRREEEERERTLSLQQGRPTIVGGVQVVPMSQGVPSRMNSERRPGEEQVEAEYEAAQQYSSQPQYSQGLPALSPAATAGPSASGYYSQPEPTTAGHGRHGSYGAGSEGAYSDGEYAIAPDGSFVRDSRGNKVPFRSPSPSDERRQGGGIGPVGSDSGGEEDYQQHPGVAHAPQPPTTTSVSYPPSASQTAQYAGTYPAAPQPPQQDYSGQGYAAPGWETLPRHHHPTRLSDVLEEDEERSRASGPSQASRA